MLITWFTAGLASAGPLTEAAPLRLDDLWEEEMTSKHKVLVTSCPQVQAFSWPQPAGQGPGVPS